MKLLFELELKISTFLLLMNVLENKIKNKSFKEILFEFNGKQPQMN